MSQVFETLFSGWYLKMFAHSPGPTDRGSGICHIQVTAQRIGAIAVFGIRLVGDKNHECIFRQISMIGGVTNQSLCKSNKTVIFETL